MTIKVDFGVVFYGLIFLLLGIFILLVSIIWGVISLFLSSDLNAPIAFSVAAVVLIAIGIADIMSGVRGWRRTYLAR